MSSERKYTGMAKLFAIEEKQQKERAAEKAAENITAPANLSEAVNSSPPEISAPPEKISAAANISATEVVPTQPLKTSVPANISAPEIFAHPEQHTRIPNEIFEDILPTLRTSEQSILLRLYRLTWGFQKDTCHVSMGKLGKSCNLSSRQVTTCIQVLEKRRLIRRVHIDLDNRNQHERGVTFQMLLPQAARAKPSPPAIISPAAKSSGGEDISDSKVNTQKENTQTQAAGVRVGSKFTIEECRKYAKHLQATGQGINNPGGYATTIHRTGEADMLIENFLHSETADPSSTLNANQCPDCHGTGFYYPQGVEGGVARCKHEQLRQEGDS